MTKPMLFVSLQQQKLYIEHIVVVHLIPDIVFRAPTPIIAIAILTVRTLQICNNRTIGTQTIQTRRNVPLMLTVFRSNFFYLLDVLFLAFKYQVYFMQYVIFV
jgi:hypothetical protein